MRALVLLSGGLDSALIARQMLDQGIDVLGIHFLNPFSIGDTQGRVRNIADALGIAVKMIGMTDEYLEIIKHPRYGYGKNLNPCIDCRIHKFKRAKELMEEYGAKFIVTGEVLGQRPMSQNRQSIELIERKSGLAGLILRPLCAKVMTPTIPEQEGWVDREKLLDITGRSRRRQLDLAETWGISGYGTPAGGCLLTEAAHADRIRDVIESDMLNMEMIKLLQYGRYFPLSRSFKLIVGRNFEENMRLLELAQPGDVLIQAVRKGPDAVGKGTPTPEELRAAETIVARYCDGAGAQVITKEQAAQNYVSRDN